MLQNDLPSSRIQILESVENWQQAIQQVAQPLIQQQIIEPRYLDAIFAAQQKLGAYYVIAPQIAMPHARPEDGALQQGLSLLIIKNGVNFASENDPVRLVLMLAAKDSHSHLAMLAQVAELLGNDEDVARIIGAASIEEISQIIHQY